MESDSVCKSWVWLWTDIGWHEVFLPINYKDYNFRDVQEIKILLVSNVMLCSSGSYRPGHVLLREPRGINYFWDFTLESSVLDIQITPQVKL